jgi:hypothetical protein
MSLMTIKVSAEEISDIIRRVLPFGSDDERGPKGQVLVRSRSGRRTWVAASHETLVLLDGGEGPEFPDVLLSPRLFHAAGYRGADDGHDIEIVLHGHSRAEVVEVVGIHMVE